MIMDFQDLLQDAEQLTAQIDRENTDLPRLQRTISQLFEAGRRKLAKTNYLSSDSNEVNASILLAGKGIDAPRLTKTIESLQVPASNTQLRYTGLDNLKDTDIHSFLKSEKEMALMSIIEDTRKKTISEIEESFWTNSEIEWEKQKQKIMNALHGTNTDVLNIIQETSINPIKTSNILHGRSLMNDVEMAYAKEIYSYNEKVISNQQPKPNLLKSFLDLSKKFNDKNIEESWNMLNCMCDVNRTTIFSDDTVDDRISVDMQKSFVKQAIKYLETCFKNYLKDAIYSNLEIAKLGGAPGTKELIKSYLRLNPNKYYTSSEELIDNQPLWAIIFLCLRCGDFDAARNVALSAKKEDIAGYLDELIRNKFLSPSSETKLKLEYKSKIKRSQDQYKCAVYRYLCRNAIGDDLSDVLDNVDDFLWFHLSSIVFNQESNGDGQTYEEFQIKMSVDYGETYFNKTRNPYPYLQVLLLTSQFELAIEFLLKFDNMIAHAVHMAIALFEKRLLNLSKLTYSQLISSEPTDPKSIKRINFPTLIKIYTRKFECTDPREALEYYYFLRDSKTQKNENYFALFISELALETREFELLFGKLEKNGIRKSGAIDKFFMQNTNNIEEIIKIVAKEIENKGLNEEAIKLYDLCNQQQHVLELCNKLISQVVSEQNVLNSNRDRLKTMALSIAQRYKSEKTLSSSLILKSTSSTFYLLTDLMTFFDLYHSENWEAAYDTINILNILPTTKDNIESKVKQFSAFSEEIKRNFPDLILAVMTIICTLYNKLNKTSPTGSFKLANSLLSNNDGGLRSRLNELREHAKALIKYVGCLPYRLPGDTNARLLQLEVMMN